MVAQNKRPSTLMQAVRHFDAETADRYIEGIKWPTGPCCPKCGSQNIGRIVSRRRFQCREKGCRKQFSLIAGTILEATHLRTEQWCVAIWMLLNCRNGVSSCEIAGTIGCKQQSAWHLMHRARAIITQDQGERMTGTVEADSSIVGGLLKHMHAKKRAEVGRWGNKSIVHAIKERASGKVRASVIEEETTETCAARSTAR